MEAGGPVTVVKFRAALNLALCFKLLFCAGGIGPLPAQDAPAQSSEAARGPVEGAEDAPPQGLAFEVASIKPNKSGGAHSNSGFNGGRFTATNVDLKTLMQYNAFGIPATQILGGPAWLSSDRFDIDAKVDDAVAEEMKKLSIEAKTRWMHRMVQEMLADRFKLAFHWETKEFPVYALVVAKNGSKIERSKNAEVGTSINSTNGNLTAKGVTMERLAQTLTQVLAREVGRIVVDKTGLEAKYDLTLKWSPDNRSAAMTDPSNENATPPGPSIFTAVQEQLGLKLESTKAPVQTLVIDHIEQPSEN
jgi:uncharacterized protein (TIGR03435 family)